MLHQIKETLPQYTHIQAVEAPTPDNFWITQLALHGGAALVNQEAVPDNLTTDEINVLSLQALGMDGATIGSLTRNGRSRAAVAYQMSNANYKIHGSGTVSSVAPHAIAGAIEREVFEITTNIEDPSEVLPKDIDVILRLASTGFNMREIGEYLDISHKAANGRQTQFRQARGLKSMGAAVLFGCMSGIIPRSSYTT